MSATGTQTTTYTVADIRKVVENFAADFSMKAQATGLRSAERVAQTVSDIRVFAETDYLVEVRVILYDKAGKELRGTLYTVSKSTIGWVPGRPGNNLWPRTPDGSLKVRAILSDAWWDKTDAQKDAFIKHFGLHGSWSKATDDITFSSLTPSQGQQYPSNGYGWDRTNYS
jgi:hypothetical protein